MVAQYRELRSPAELWTYKSESSLGSTNYRRSLQMDDPHRIGREQEYAEQVRAARSLTTETGEKIAQLAKRLATGDGFHE